MQSRASLKFDLPPTATWFPHIGLEYHNVPSAHRLLLIGESHYQNANEEEKYKDPFITQEIVRNIGNRRVHKSAEIKRPTQFFVNIHRTFLPGQKFEGNNFWNYVSFYNFIQVPMSSKHHRPTKEQWVEGWQNFEEMIRLLQPNACVFLGFEAANALNTSLLNLKLSYRPLAYGESIGRSKTRYTEVTNSFGKAIPMIFIKHPSMFFSPNRWRNVLKSQIPDTMEWILMNVR